MSLLLTPPLGIVAGTVTGSMLIGKRRLWKPTHGMGGLRPMPGTPKEPLSPATIAFGQRLRELRQERGWSQERLAEAAGLHWTYVGQIERGRRNVTLHNVLKLARGLGVDAGVLVAGLEVEG